MPKQKLEIEVDVPEGWDAVDYRIPIPDENESYIDAWGTTRHSSAIPANGPRIILRKREPELRPYTREQIISMIGRQFVVGSRMYDLVGWLDDLAVGYSACNYFNWSTPELLRDGIWSPSGERMGQPVEKGAE